MLTLSRQALLRQTLYKCTAISETAYRKSDLTTSRTIPTASILQHCALAVNRLKSQSRGTIIASYVKINCRFAANDKTYENLSDRNSTYQKNADPNRLTNQTGNKNSSIGVSRHSTAFLTPFLTSSYNECADVIKKQRQCRFDMFMTSQRGLHSDAKVVSQHSRITSSHAHSKSSRCASGMSAGQNCAASSSAAASSSTAAATASAAENVTLSAITVVEATLNRERRMLEVSWNDGEQTQYPFVWLRDCCQCPDCFHPMSKSRRLLFHRIDLHAVPTDIEKDSKSQEISLTWSDGHRSVYSYHWLLQRSFRPAEQALRDKWFGRKPLLWKSELGGRVPTFVFHELMTDDKAQYDWLTEMEETGFTMIKGVPLERGQLRKITDRIGFLRKTCYGPISRLEIKSSASNIGYTACTLVIHNDLAYYDYMPGVLLMHCIKQAGGEGGGNEIVDGFEAARQLREQSPEHFRLLSTTLVDFYHTGSDFIDFYQLARRPVIKVDEAGAVVQVSFSTHGRDTFLPLPLDQVEPYYAALEAFMKLLYDPRNVVNIKLQPGDIVCLNNWRVLHGRRGFELEPEDSRVLEHCYVDWDEMHSRRRVLKGALAIPDELY